MEEETMRLSSSFSLRAALAILLALLAVPAAWAQQPIKVGIVTLLSGPAAGPFGVPARNSAELMAEFLNAGRVPAPYTQKGFAGTPIELVIIDEAGGPQKQVAEFRNLVSRAELGIGYISSGDRPPHAPGGQEVKKSPRFFY